MELTQDEYRRDYKRVKVLYEDIHYLMYQFASGKNTNERLIALKYAMIPLNQLLDMRKSLAIYSVELPVLQSYDKLFKQLDFFKHVRNKISGHLDNDIVETANEWEPFIFAPNCKDDKDFQFFAILKSLFETAINSHDRQGDQQLFKKEMDLLVDERLLITTIAEVMTDALNYLSHVMLYIDEKKLQYTSHIDGVIKAAEVDFKKLGKRRH